MIPIIQSKRVIIKVGTGLLRSNEGLINHECIETISKEVFRLRENGIDVILVSSGAIGLGMAQLKIEKRPKSLNQLQACAAIGQSQLINLWQKHLDSYNLTVAQILLTQDDLASSNRYNGVTDTLQELLSKGAIPIVNENDTVSTEEIKFGDNDTLSALVAKAMKADLLMILSNISGLMDPNDNYRVVPIVESITPAIESLATDTQKEISVGGMKSKLSAAKIAVDNCCGVFIGSGNDPKIFQKLSSGKSVGTYFLPKKEK